MIILTTNQCDMNLRNTWSLESQLEFSQTCRNECCKKLSISTNLRNQCNEKYKKQRKEMQRHQIFYSLGETGRELTRCFLTIRLDIKNTKVICIVGNSENFYLHPPQKNEIAQRNLWHRQTNATGVCHESYTVRNDLMDDQQLVCITR